MHEQWKANWIWSDLPENTPNVYMEFRKTFFIPSSLKSAQLRISANQEYKLYINGMEVGRGPSPCDNAWQYFDVHDVRKRLRQGENVFAVLVYNFGNKEIVTQQFQGPGADSSIGCGNARRSSTTLYR
jgi:alpha-L-rhamnosidase